MNPVPGADDSWYEEEFDKAFPPDSRDAKVVVSRHTAYHWNLAAHWVDHDVFAGLRAAYRAAKAGDRTAQRLLKETYERYIVAKLTG